MATDKTKGKTLQLHIDGKAIGTANVVPFTTIDRLHEAGNHSTGTCEIWEYYLIKKGVHSFRNIHTGEKRHTSKVIPFMQYGTLVTLEFIEK